jgi:DivIVA domain-containing protein
MALTPDDIRSREFHLADRGYDRAEVRDFLAELADRFAAVPGPGVGGTPWPEAEERLLLILDAAERAVAAIREESRRALLDLQAVAEQVALAGRTAAAELTAAGSAAAGVALPPEPTPTVGELQARLAGALHDVEAALGAIDAQPDDDPEPACEPGDQGRDPSTRPSS